MIETLQAKWEQRATVRSHPRIEFNPNISGYLFPISHQPLCLHPLVAELGDEAMQFLLIQSLYKYSNDIALIETKIVCQSALNITADRLSVIFPAEYKLNAFTVMTDEAYHAYVAFDAMQQIQKFTRVEPVTLPKTIEIEVAIKKIKSKLAEKYHREFELIAVCLAENTLTKEIVTMTDQDETHPFFQQIIKEHLTDESRHCGYFQLVLTYLWQHLDSEAKAAIGLILADFIEAYLGVEVQIEFMHRVLIAMGLGLEAAREALADIYDGFKLTKNHPMIKNIIFQLQRTQVLDATVIPGFQAKGWLCA